jgi:hypothetical protein
VKRLRHKRGDSLLLYYCLVRCRSSQSADVNAGVLSEDLHQYVVYDSQPAGLQRIKLDDPPRNAYTPPSSLAVHLSKIPMPELNPRPTVSKHHPSPEPPRRPSTPPSARQQSVTQAHPASAPLERLLRGGSTLFNRDSPPPSIPTQQQQHQTTGFGSLWGRPRK